MASQRRRRRGEHNRCAAHGVAGLETSQARREQSAEFKAIGGLTPAAWIRIGIQLRERLEAFVEFSKVEKHKDSHSQKMRKGEKANQLRKLLKQRYETGRSGW